jgi:hypothetical protein
MRRSALSLSACFITILVLRAPAYAQAAAEAGLGAAASSIGTAGAGGVGKSVGGLFKNLDQTLKSSGSAATSTTVSPGASGSSKAVPRDKAAAAKSESAPRPNYEDAMQIQKDIGYEELLRRFGPPAMQFAGADDSRTMTYVSAGGSVQLELKGEKVIGVEKTKSGT